MDDFFATPKSWIPLKTAVSDSEVDAIRKIMQKSNEILSQSEPVTANDEESVTQDDTIDSAGGLSVEQDTLTDTNVKKAPDDSTPDAAQTTKTEDSDPANAPGDESVHGDAAKEDSEDAAEASSAPDGVADFAEAAEADSAPANSDFDAADDAAEEDSPPEDAAEASSAPDGVADLAEAAEAESAPANSDFDAADDAAEEEVSPAPGVVDAKSGSALVAAAQDENVSTSLAEHGPPDDADADATNVVDASALEVVDTGADPVVGDKEESNADIATEYKTADDDRGAAPVRGGPPESTPVDALEFDLHIAPEIAQSDEILKIVDSNTHRELKDMCKEYSLNASGKKMDLATRIYEYKSRTGHSEEISADDDALIVITS